MKTKITSLFLVLILCFGMSSHAADSISSYGESREAEQGMALIDILTDGSHFTSDENGFISRADFLYTLSELINLPFDKSSSVPYTDVDAESFVYGYVSSAYRLGYISESEYFNPYTPIKVNEALKLAVCATGYKNLAEVKGAYPSGYLTVALQNKLILSAESFSSEYLTLHDAKVLIFRIMTCNYMKNSAITADGSVSYETYDGVTLLSDIYSIYPFEGLVTATEESSLTNPSYLAENMVEIDGISYPAECESCGYLGYRVNGFYREKSQKYTVIYMSPYENTVLELHGDEFAYSASTKEITYTEGNRDIRCRLDGLYSFIYNGRAYPTHTASDFLNQFASYKFIDNDADRDFDVVYMLDEVYMKFGELNDFSTYISDTNGFSPAINVSSSDIKITVNKSDGTKCEWYTLPSGTVVAAAVSKDGNLVVIRELGMVVSGIVTEFDNVNDKVVIDGKAYRTSSYLLNEIGNLKLGTEYSFVTDGDILVSLSGGIAAAEVYGYLIKAALETTGLQSKGMFKILTESGEIQIFESAEKIKYNGSYNYLYTDADFWAKLTSRQLIKYSMNEDGKIKAVRTASPASDNPFDETPSEENSFRKFDTPSPYYRSRTRSFSPYGRINTAKFFVVPISDEYAEIESKYAVVSWDNPKLFLDNNETYNNSENGYVEMYDISENGECPVVLFKHDTRMDGDYTTASIGVVEKLTSYSNESGADKKLYLISGGAYVSYPVQSDVNVNVKCGDIVRYVVNSKGEISRMTLDFEGKNMVMNATGINNFSSTAAPYVMGKIYSAADGYMYVSPISSYSQTPDWTWASLKNLRYSSAAVVVYDHEKNTVRIGDSSDFDKYRESGNGSYIVAKTDQYLDVTLILILQNR